MISDHYTPSIFVPISKCTLKPSESPQFWVDWLSVDLEASQGHRVGLTRVLVRLHHSKGREATHAHLAPEYAPVDAPSRGVASLANSAEGGLAVHVSKARVKSHPTDEIVGCFESPRCHDKGLLRACCGPQRVTRRQQSPPIHELQPKEREWRITGLSISVSLLEAQNVRRAPLSER